MMSADLIPPEKMEIFDANNVLRHYKFNTDRARHHFCSRCGIHVFVETRLNPGHFRINLGCVEGLEPFGLPEATYPGKEL